MPEWDRQLSRAQERADHQTSLKSGEPNTSLRQAPQFNAKSTIDVLGAAQCTITRRALITRNVARDLHRLVKSPFGTGMAFLPIFGITSIPNDEAP
jgi:hypothetical protein